MSGGDRWAGVELGGTKSIVALATGDDIIERLSIPTTRPDDVLAAVVDQLAEWHAASPLEGIGIASFGPVRLDSTAADYGCILDTPKPNWSGAPVLSAIAKRFNCPIAIDTDVSAAALAEFRWGAGRGCDVLTYVTIGTGIGGGTLVQGQSIRGRLHPEVGHLVPRRAAGDGFAGNCPFHGDCIEGLVSGPALAKRFGKEASHVPADDPRWNDVAHDLAQFFAMLVLAYAPQRIIVGGGVGLGISWLLPMAIDQLEGILGAYYSDFNAAELHRLLVPAALGKDAGPLGAIALAQAARDQT